MIVLNPTVLGFKTKDIEVKRLQSGGAMPLLCGNVDINMICLLGRWKLDAMLQYLQIQALPISYHFSKRMIAHGNFTLLYPGVAVSQVVVGHLASIILACLNEHTAIWDGGEVKHFTPGKKKAY